ncbi:TolC family protein [Sulfurimonas sp. MAG313]|nr:TolC family protein [Sulfurimonas sp. MAG313]MDF1880355.1 TolC family protein [Sulfurimonas sp. MAG313]
MIKKDYPLSNSEFLKTGLEKPMENGMQLSLNYRRAQGVQEYNNIKTSEQGEVLVGLKIPIFALTQEMNGAKRNLYAARLNTKKMDYIAQDKMRFLYFDVLTSYYKMLYFYESETLILELLNSSKKRVEIIKKRVEVGSIARLSLLEARQQIINREQRYTSIQNKSENALKIFLKYLNMQEPFFKENFTLPLLSHIKDSYVKETISEEMALAERTDLKVLTNDLKQFDLEHKYNSVQKYPKLDIGLYGVHDFEYENGFKVTLAMSFPIQRRSYISRDLEIKKSIQNINKMKEKKEITIKTNLSIIQNSIRTVLKNLENSKLEVALVQELEEAENKKYNVGLSNLFMVNQREIYTLQIKKKLLKYNLDYLLYQQEIHKIMGKSLDVFAAETH